MDDIFVAGCIAELLLSLLLLLLLLLRLLLPGADFVPVHNTTTITQQFNRITGTRDGVGECTQTRAHDYMLRVVIKCWASTFSKREVL